jgi:hypothetical protein
VPRGHCPPAASADRMLFPLCGAIKQQASKRIPSRSVIFKIHSLLLSPAWIFRIALDTCPKSSDLLA